MLNDPFAKGKRVRSWTFQRLLVATHLLTAMCSRPAVCSAGGPAASAAWQRRKSQMRSGSGRLVISVLFMQRPAAPTASLREPTRRCAPRVWCVRRRLCGDQSGAGSVGRGSIAGLRERPLTGTRFLVTLASRDCPGDRPLSVLTGHSPGGLVCRHMAVQRCTSNRSDRPLSFQHRSSGHELQPEVSRRSAENRPPTHIRTGPCSPPK